jgi:hypothetical protein
MQKAEQPQSIHSAVVSRPLGKLQTIWIILRASFPCYNWRIPRLGFGGAVGQIERQREGRLRLTPAHPCSGENRVSTKRHHPRPRGG